MAARTGGDRRRVSREGNARLDPKRAEAAARYRERIAQILADWSARWPAVFTKPGPLAIGISRYIKQEPGADRPTYREIGSAFIAGQTATAIYAPWRGARRNLDGSEAGVPEEARAKARRFLRNASSA